MALYLQEIFGFYGLFLDRNIGAFAQY